MPGSGQSALASKREGPGEQGDKVPVFRRAVVPARDGVRELAGDHSFPCSEERHGCFLVRPQDPRQALAYGKN